MPLTYTAAITRLLGLADFERKSRAGEPPDFHLRRMARLLALLGNPHLGIPTVHVAGSKGKGSTAAMITSALRAAGLRAGLYTSPHLHAFNERIRMGLTPIEKPAIASLIDELWPHVEAVSGDGGLGGVSVFELLTTMAFAHFQRQEADAQVIEVGLGGRLDATNLVEPEVAVLTPISLDHVQVLGNSVHKIAGEKAGIIKPGATVVVASQSPAAAAVFRRAARDAGAELRDAAHEIGVLAAKADGPRQQRVALAGRRGEYRFKLPLLGAHQVDNARTAVCALEAMVDRGHEISVSAIQEGLESVAWPARAELLAYRSKSVLVDGAHNDASAVALAAAIRRHFPDASSSVLILGGSSGHVFADTALALMPINPRVVVTRTRHPKSLPPSGLVDALLRHNMQIVGTTDDSASALEMACNAAAPNELIVAAGSLFVASEIRELVLGIEPELYPDLKGPYTAAYSTGRPV